MHFYSESESNSLKSINRITNFPFFFLPDILYRHCWNRYTNFCFLFRSPPACSSVCPTVGKEAALQVFEQEGDGKHLLSVGKYGAWNITKPEQVHAEKWMVSPRMFWIYAKSIFKNRLLTWFLGEQCCGSSCLPRWLSKSITWIEVV